MQFILGELVIGMQLQYLYMFKFQVYLTLSGSILSDFFPAKYPDNQPQESIRGYDNVGCRATEAASNNP